MKLNYFLILRSLWFFLVVCSMPVATAQQTNPNNLPLCPKFDPDKGIGQYHRWTSCWGERKEPTSVYTGEFLDGEFHGLGIIEYRDASSANPIEYRYAGEWKNSMRDGWGVLYKRGKIIQEGSFKENVLSIPSKVDLTKIFSAGRVLSEKAAKPQSSGQTLDSEIQKYSKTNPSFSLVISYSQPDFDGGFEINIQTNVDTASLKINGQEVGGRADGRYTVRKFARAGQDTPFTIIAKDTNGNTETRMITVTRTVADSSPKFDSLDPLRVRSRSAGDAVAVIIGIQNYRRVPKADFAADDARAFYDYAIRALGVKPENIKLLVDEQADEAEILATLKNWLPVKVKKARTDVYLFYSGHGLPSDDGKSLYILPHGADRQFIDKTALNQQEVITALKALQAKSVTLFMDACYSGQMRTGDTLLASARPLSLRTSVDGFPRDFTVFTASSPEQIASSSPSLKHGIFSYYLMKGMEGDADENKDGRITVAELQTYLSEMVGRQAMTLSRRQEPQVIGDSNRILVAK